MRPKKKDKKKPISAAISPEDRSYAREKHLNISKIIGLVITRLRQYGFASLYLSEVTKTPKHNHVTPGEESLVHNTAME